MPLPNPKQKIHHTLTEFRNALAYIDALPQLTLLGFIVGSVTGLIIIVFRSVIELPLRFLLPGHSENFEALSPLASSLLILGGACVLAAMMHFIAPGNREMSVSHVLDRMHNHQGKMPLRNWWLQFVGAVVCLVSGQSVGREGPVVHLGAGAASLLAQALKLPNNSMQILVGCGVAAAISASFDTPMAGVIFAIEVLALEYTLVGLLPVILASVMGTAISKAVLGNAALVVVGDTSLNSLLEIPLMVVIGAAIALCASIYIRLNKFAIGMQRVPVSLRILLAGLLMAGAAPLAPQIMGQGFDTVNAALAGQSTLTLLLVIGLLKLCVTPTIIGLGMPGGLIGPMLVIGACIGGALGLLVAQLFPGLAAQPGFYVMMGMAGMMAASLNAPLTALVTVLELTANPNSIFPAMLVVVIACLLTRHGFKLKGIFVEQLEQKGKPLDFAPTKQALRRAGVRSVMEKRVALCPIRLRLDDAQTMLAAEPVWLLIHNEAACVELAMRAADLAHCLSHRASEATLDPHEEIDLNDIPARRCPVGAVHESASLYEAMQIFIQEPSTEVIYISGTKTVEGVLTRADIENYYRPSEFKHAVG